MPEPAGAPSTGAAGGEGSAPSAGPADSGQGSQGAQGQASKAGGQVGGHRDPGTGKFTKAGGPRLKESLDHIPDSDFEAPKGGVEAPGEGRSPASAQTAAPAVPGQAPPAPTPAKFKLGDLEWDSEAAAVQSIKTLRGQYKTWQQQIQQLQQENEEFKRRAAAPPTPAPQPQAAPQDPSQGKPDAKAGAAPSPEQAQTGIDWALYKAIAEQQGPEAAAAWLFQEGQKQAAEALKQDFTRQLESAVGPLQAQAAYQERVGKVVNVYDQLAGAVVVDQAGQPHYAYPELQNGEVAQFIGELWARLPFTEEFRNSPAGLHLAVVAYRDMVRGVGPSPSLPTSPAGAPQAGAAAAAAQVTQALTGSQSTGQAVGGPSAPFVRPAVNGLDSEEDQIRRGIDAAALPDSKTGFYR